MTQTHHPVIAYHEAIKRAYADRGLAPTLTPIPATKTPVKPEKGLLQGFVYTPAAKTNVRETWIRFGWKPINDNY